MKATSSYIYFCLFVIFTGIISCKTDEKTLVVVPNNYDQTTLENEPVFFKISDALNAARTLKNKGYRKIIINIQPGVYRLNSTLKIDPELSDLEIRGAGHNKVFIKGSELLQPEWKSFNENIWVTKVNGTFQFDHFYVNGEKQVRARYPNYDENGGHWQGHAPDAISKERVSTWVKPNDGIVHAMHSGEWGGFHYKINKKYEDNSLELSGGHQNNRPSEMHQKYRMVENVFEELDSPGEWYLDQSENKLYYWPLDKLKLQNQTYEAVKLSHLIDIVGTEESPVKNVHISGITFEHSSSTILKNYEPLLRSDWTIYRGGALFIEGTEDSSISKCEFRNLGGNVIFVSKYNRNFAISGNHIHDSGASAISFVGDPSAVRSPSFQYGEFVPLSEMDTVAGPLNNAYPSNCSVTDNLIYRIGRIEKQTAGVQISMAKNISIQSNSIYEVPRSGINISEGTWGGHLIAYNDVFNTVLETSDHGALNSWGRDRFWHPNRKTLDELTTNNPKMPYWDAIETTVIRNNRFRCDHGWDIDLDDGSSNYHIYNNLCLKGGIKLREGFYRTVENNIMVNNSFHPHVWFENSGDIFRKNIVMLAYKDIRLQGWGKELDFNLFPNEKALDKAQLNGTDVNSRFGNPNFRSPETGDYQVLENSIALKLGFKNFEMNQFGVKSPNLKELAETPELPQLWSIENEENKIQSLKWLGSEIKNIESLAEKSASGLSKVSGVLLLKIEEHSIMAVSPLEVGDVIVKSEGVEILTVKDLLKVFEGNNWKGKLALTVIRDQKPLDLILLTKK